MPAGENLTWCELTLDDWCDMDLDEWCAMQLTSAVEGGWASAAPSSTIARLRATRQRPRSMGGQLIDLLNSVSGVVDVDDEEDIV